jgi:small-conductance mechanosensitive channel
MALTLDTSPARQVFDVLAAGITTGTLLRQVAVAAVAVLLAWLLAHAIFKRVQPSGRWKFGAGDFERVAYPLLAYVFTVIGRAILARYQPVALLDIVAAALVAWVVIRVAVYILGHVLPAGAPLRIVVRVVAWIAWIAVVLHVTGLLPEVIQVLDEIGIDTGKDKQRISLWLVAQGAAALGVTLALSLWVARVTESRVMAAATVDMSTRVVISKVVRVSAVFIAVLIALPLVGIDITTLSIFGGAFGVGLGFGLQKIAANYVSGFIVLLDRSLRIGDTVTIADRRGEVKEIASRFTVIRGGDGVETIIPNEKLITEIVLHHTYTDTRISMVLAACVAFDTDVDRACQMLLEVAARQSRTLKDPAPTARVKGLGDHGVLLELTVWVADPAAGESDLRSELYKDLLKSFRAGGISLAYLNRDVRRIATTATEEMPAKTVP